MYAEHRPLQSQQATQGLGYNQKLRYTGVVVIISSQIEL